MTLLAAINSCGGFDEYANKKMIRIIRGQQIIVIDAVQAAKVPGTDSGCLSGEIKFTFPARHFKVRTGRADRILLAEPPICQFSSR